MAWQVERQLEFNPLGPLCVPLRGGLTGHPPTHGDCLPHVPTHGSLPKPHAAGRSLTSKTLPSVRLSHSPTVYTVWHPSAWPPGLPYTNRPFNPALPDSPPDLLVSPSQLARRSIPARG